MKYFTELPQVANIDGIPPLAACMMKKKDQQPRRSTTFRGCLAPRGGFLIQHGKRALIKVAWANAENPCCDAVVCCMRTPVVPSAALCTKFDLMPPRCGIPALHAAVAARMNRPGGQYAPVGLNPACGETITFSTGELPGGLGACGTKGTAATPLAVEALIDSIGARSACGVGVQFTYLGGADMRKHSSRHRSVASSLGGGDGGCDGMVGTIVLFTSDCSHGRLLRVTVIE
jgi:hypothetical protein